MTKRRDQFTGVPADFVRQLQAALARADERLDALERDPGRAGIVLRSTSANAGQFLNIEAPAGGLTILLPEATAALRNERVTLSFRNTNPVKIEAVRGTVNRETFVINTAVGTFEAVADGLGGWSVETGVSSSGSAVNAQYVLGAAHASLPQGAVATDTAEIDVTVTPGGTATWALRAASVVFSKLANLTGLSVLGRAANSTGVMAAITAVTPRHVLQLNPLATSLQWGFPTLVSDDGATAFSNVQIDFISTTSIAATATDSGSGVATASFQRNALTGFAAAAANSNATTSAEPIVTYAASSNMSAERVATSGISIVANITVANQIFFQRAALTGDVTAPLDSNVTTIAKQIILSVPGFDSDYDQGEPFVMPGPPGRDGSPGTIGVDGAIGRPGLDGEDGLDGERGPPGQSGADGVQGIAGADGRPAFVIYEPYDTGEPIAYPGTPGAAGIDGTPGVAGANGQPAVIMADVYDDGEPFVMPGPAGAAGGVGAAGAAGAQGAGGPPGAELTYDAAEPMQAVYPPSGNTAEVSEIVVTGLSGNLGTVNIAQLRCGGSVRFTAMAGAFQVEGFSAREEGFWFEIVTQNSEIQTFFYEDVTATAVDRMRLSTECDALGIGIQGTCYYKQARWRANLGAPSFVAFVGPAVAGGDIRKTSSLAIANSGTGNWTAGSLSFNSTNTVCDVNVNGVRISGTSPYLTWLESASSVLSVAAGDGMAWVLNEAPNQLMFTDDTNADWRVGYACPGIPITANAAATNAATNLTCCTATIPASALRVGSTFRFTGWWVYVHTAAATPTLTAELLFGSTVISTCIITPTSTALTHTGKVETVMTVRTLGNLAAGTVMCQSQDVSSVWAVGATGGSNNTATSAFDTTVSNAMTLRIRMTTAVASNTLTVTNGYPERLI